MTASLRENPLRDVKPSARVKLAIGLYVTGACPTKRSASIAAGLHPAYLAMLTAPNAGSDPTKQLLDELTTRLLDKTVDMSVTLNQLGRLGLAKIAQLTIHGGNERIQLDAAKTLADRSPETAGIQKLQVDGLSLGSADAKALAEALVESAGLRHEYAHVAEHGLVELDVTQGAESVDSAGIAVGSADSSPTTDQVPTSAVGPSPEEGSVRMQLRLEK